MAVLLAVAGLSPAASAQTVLNDALPLERLHLSTTRSGIVSVEGGDVPKHQTWEIGAWVGWSSNPLVVYRDSDDARLGSLVRNRVGGSLMASMGLWGWGQLGIEVPLILFQDRRIGPDVTVGELPALSSVGIGSLRLVPKAQLLNVEHHGVDLAVLGHLTIPTSSGSSFFGDTSFSFQPELAASRSFGAFRVAGNLGAAFRERYALLNLEVQSELMAQLGAGYRLHGEGTPLELQLALSGNISASEPFAQSNDNAMELRGMATYDVSGPLQLFVGAGRGLARGWGTPDWRAFGGLRLTHMAEEPPAPVLAAAPVDGDGDGLPDTADRCPAEPETINEFEDSDGCPDSVPVVVVDSDGDSLPDTSDQCPQQAEDRDDFEDSDGCPDEDNDRDGVADAADACVLQAGPIENKGCPDKDSDSDALVDRLDECPDLAGPADNKGCPKNANVKLTADRIDFKGTIYFETNKDVIQKNSFELLDSIATVIKAHPEIPRIRVEGHTDNQGKLAHNMSLSQRRAQAIVRYLVGKGVGEERLVAEGFGPTRPVADNGTKDGRAKNRRVEFHVVSTPPSPPTESPTPTTAQPAN